MKKYLFSFFILCILLAAKSYAQTEQEYTIMGILVEGNESGAAETIIAQSQLRKGQTIVIQNDDIRKAISRIWQQNIFSDVDRHLSYNQSKRTSSF
jgi:outer membrane protein assembly factor BamA